MIPLTRISGSQFTLNCDLIERVDSTPDTVVSLVDGKKYVVLESLHEVTLLIRRYRAEVIAMGHCLQDEFIPQQGRGPHAPVLANVASIHTEL